MIKSIKKISNIGIYNKFVNEGNLEEFARYNLFYGWNGSGKSSLSRLFRILENKKMSEENENLEFQIEMVNGTCINEKNVELFQDKIRVFNDDFIEDNIDWNSKIESILLMSQEKIKEITEYKKLKKEIFGDEYCIGLIAEIDELKDSIEINKKDVGNILSTGAKNVKDKLKLIETTDTYYSNYNKTKAEKFIDENRESFLKGKGILTEKDVEIQAKKASPLKKEKINNIPNIYDKQVLVTIEIEVKKVLNTIITAKVIDELKENKELSDWVEKGLEFHKKDNIVKCIFCGGDITDTRIQDLENHYNKAFQVFKNNISKIKQKLERNEIDIDKIEQDKNLFYSEFSSKIEELNCSLRVKSKELNEIITTIDSYLVEKDNKPFEIVEYKNQDIENKVEEYNNVIKNIQEVIEKHNKKTEDFESITKEAKKKLELHYLSQHLKDLHYFKKCKEISNQEDEYTKKKELIEIKHKRYINLEAELSNETLGAEEFNKKLRAFLGHGEIKLVFDKEKKGYKIIRADNSEAKQLSEGEKTSIAFLYFITKLHENDQNIKDLIIVIDDPISSFDSNKIFHAYAFLKAECEDAKQLFVLTHNYNYYSMILSWFNKKKIRDSNGEKIPNYRLYKIEAVMENGKRKSKISNSGSGMTQSSEYDYVFYNVYKMRENQLSKDDLIYCGNVSRKLVESFLSFKFPGQRGDLAALLEAAFKEEGKEGQVIKEKIYKFINVYSHHKQIDVFGQLDVDILESNSENIVCEILNMMERLDKEHYEAMVKKAEEELKKG